MSETAIQVEDLTVGYEGAPVLEGVDLQVARGEFLAMIGPNGAGKSTLLKAMIGLLRPWQGRVLIFGTPLDRFTEWAKLGYVPQQNGAGGGFPATVAEVVASGRVSRVGLFRRFSRADRDAVDRTLAAAGLEDLRGRPIGKLSGGQRQRVLIARALVGDPEVLLLDEPASGVDRESAEQFLALLGRLHRERGLTVLYITHNLDLLRPFLTHVALIDGRVLYHGGPEGLQQQEEAVRFMGRAALIEHGGHGGVPR